MANRTQAKAAIDAAVTDVKADIDNILPSGVNIKDGSISFGPTRYIIILDAGGSGATALSLLTSIQTALTNAGRTSFKISRADRRADDLSNKTIIINETKLTVIITNF